MKVYCLYDLQSLRYNLFSVVRTFNFIWYINWFQPGPFRLKGINFYGKIFILKKNGLLMVDKNYRIKSDYTSC